MNLQEEDMVQIYWTTKPFLSQGILWKHFAEVMFVQQCLALTDPIRKIWEEKKEKEKPRESE